MRRNLAEAAALIAMIILVMCEPTKANNIAECYVNECLGCHIERR
jgi:hypothetical protein